MRRVRSWVLVVLFALVCVAPVARANYWCDKAAEFNGNCTGCNALCVATLIFEAMGGW